MSKRGKHLILQNREGYMHFLTEGNTLVKAFDNGDGTWAVCFNVDGVFAEVGSTDVIDNPTPEKIWDNFKQKVFNGSLKK